MKELSQQEITRKGDPRKPHGEEGALMLRRMNESHAPLTEWALSLTEFREDDTVLDIGCGGGAALQRLSGYLPDGRLYGVDYSELSVKLARENNAGDISSGKMDIVQASVEALPFPDGSFDKIITVESFYFWPEPSENLREVLRVLRPGGEFLLIAEIYQKDGLSHETLDNIALYQLHNPTREQFRELLTNAGFTAIQIHTKDGTDWICAEGRKPLDKQHEP